MKKSLVSVFLLLIILSLGNTAFATESSKSTTPEPYTKKEFPQWAKDLRRLEIITFGSLPFVTLDVTLGYSMYNYVQHNFDSSYMPNPFSATSSFSTDEQLGIIATSCLISLGLGLTDYIIAIIKRESLKKKQGQNITKNVRIVPSENTKTSAPPPNFQKRPAEYLYGEIESAIF